MRCFDVLGNEGHEGSVVEARDGEDDFGRVGGVRLRARLGADGALGTSQVLDRMRWERDAREDLCRCRDTGVHPTTH